MHKHLSELMKLIRFDRIISLQRSILGAYTYSYTPWPLCHHYFAVSIYIRVEIKTSSEALSSRSKQIVMNYDSHEFNSFFFR